MLRGVLFDIGGVVIDDNNAYVKRSMQQNLGIDQATMSELWNALVPLLGSVRIDEPEFWRRATQQFGVRQVDANEDLLGEPFASSLKIRPEIQALLGRLRDKNIHKVAVSNTIQNHADILRRAGVYDNFDDLILSHEVAVRKPDAAMYRLALDRAGLNANEVILVDDRTKNLDPAREMGIRTILAMSEDQIVHDVSALIG